MPAVYELKYRDGRVEELVDADEYYYVLGHDSLQRFFTVPAWCHHCDAIEFAEDLAQPADIKAELEQISDPDSE